MKKQILKSNIFLSLEDTDINEKEVTYGVDIDIDDDSLTHSLFSMSYILDSEIYVPDPWHFVHNSLIDGVQPSVFLDVFLAKSSPISVMPLTILDLMCFCISFGLDINTQSLLEYFEHILPSSFHTSTTKDSLSIYSYDSIDVLICVLLEYLEAISTHEALAFTLFDIMSSLCS